MPRIEIELTSCRPDGTWTWRAAGARQPKGSLEGSVLPDGAKVGDVLKAEADVDIEGILVRSTFSTQPKRADPERLAILGSGKEEPGVTTNLRTDTTGGDDRRGGRGRDDRDRPRDGQVRSGRGRPEQGRPHQGAGRATQTTRPEGRSPRPPDRGDRQRHDARPGRDGPAGDRPVRDRPTGDRPGGDRPAGDRPVRDRPTGDGPAGDRPGGDRPTGDRPTGDRAARPAGNRPAGERPAASARPQRDGQQRDSQRGRPGRERSDRPTRGPGGATGPARPSAKRLQPGRAHRDAVVADLSPEQRVVADHVLRGGLAAVRQAVEEQNAKARAVGGPEIKAEALMAIAEELLPRLRAGEWRDKAEAAAASVDEISLRDLRAVVTGAEVARDEEARTLAAGLREALERRSAAEQQAWVGEITASLDAGRVVRALRISGRPPEPGFRFPAEIAIRLSGAASDALTPDATADRWAAVLEAAVASPVRRTIKPLGLPAEPGAELAKAIRLAAPRIPSLGGLVGDDTAPQRPPRPRAQRPVPRPEAAAPTPTVDASAGPSASTPEGQPPVPAPLDDAEPTQSDAQIPPTEDAKLAVAETADPAPATPPIEAATPPVETVAPPISAATPPVEAVTPPLQPAAPLQPAVPLGSPADLAGDVTGVAPSAVAETDASAPAAEDGEGPSVAATEYPGAAGSG